MLSSASDKAKLFVKNFSKNSNLHYSRISLPGFPSRTNLRLHIISITPKMVRKVIKNLDSSKASGPDYIPVVILKNCEPELPYILAKLFNKCLKESCFPDCWKVSSVVLVLRILGKRLQLKTTTLLAFFLWLVKSLKNFFFTNLSLMEFQVRYLALFLLFLVIGGFGVFWMGNFHKNMQLVLVFLKGLFLVLHFSYYTLMTFLMMLSVILLSMLMILLSTLNVIRHLIFGNN